MHYIGCANKVHVEAEKTFEHGFDLILSQFPVNWVTVQVTKVWLICLYHITESEFLSPNSYIHLPSVQKASVYLITQNIRTSRFFCFVLQILCNTNSQFVEFANEVIYLCFLEQFIKDGINQGEGGGVAKRWSYFISLFC